MPMCLPGSDDDKNFGSLLHASDRPPPDIFDLGPFLSPDRKDLGMTAWAITPIRRSTQPKR